jgi:hypothetical protein
MIDYKQILADLSSIAYHHEQINSFGFGDLAQCTNDIESDQEPHYTRMYVVPGQILFNQNSLNYNLSIIIMDRVNNDLSNLEEIMSDTMEIQKDIFTIFYQSYTENYGNFSWDFIPQQYISCQPFLERFETIVGGWTMNLSFDVAFDYNKCLPPVRDDYNFPQDEEFKSLKIILDDIYQFSILHEQVKSYGFGDIEQLTNDIITKKEPKYPRVYTLVDQTNFHSGQIEYGFKIFITDILNNDLSNQQYVLSDTLEIAKDLFSKLYLSDYSAEWGATIIPFFEKTETGLGGWILNVTSKQKSDYNRCVLPTTSFGKQLTWEEVAELWRLEAQKWNSITKY